MNRKGVAPLLGALIEGIPVLGGLSIIAIVIIALVILFTTALIGFFVRPVLGFIILAMAVYIKVKSGGNKNNQAFWILLVIALLLILNPFDLFDKVMVIAQ